MDEKTEKDIILFDDSNSYSFCYFYSGAFNQKDLELKLSELYNKKFGENAKFSYKITQKTGNNTWFASIGCRGKDIVPNKINFPASYFVASVISKKYKDEYIYVTVEESSSFTVFLCYNEPIYSSKIGNKLLAISSGIGKEIAKMSETFSNSSGIKLNVDKIVFYGSLSKEQIGLITVSGINKKIKEDELDYALFDSSLNLTSSNHFVDSNIKTENNVSPVAVAAPGEHVVKNTKTVTDSKTNNPSNFASVPEVEITEPSFNNGKIDNKPERISPVTGKFISGILTAIIIGAMAFPLTSFAIKAMDFYTGKISSNIDALKNSSISTLPDSLSKEINDKISYLTSLSEIKDYQSDIVDNTINKTLFEDSSIAINNFSIANGIYDIKIEVSSEKDFLNYLSNILFSNKFVLAESPTEILPGKTYEIKIIPVPAS